MVFRPTSHFFTNGDYVYYTGGGFSGLFCVLQKNVADLSICHEWREANIIDDQELLRDRVLVE